MIAREAGSPFDLANGPVLRLLLLRQSHRDHVLVVNIHHIATDGWSMGILVREIGALPGLRAGASVAAPRAAGHVRRLRRLAAALARRTGARGAARLLAPRELAGAPALLELPADRPRPAVQTSRGAELAFTLPAGTTAAVHALARQTNATPFMVLLSAFQVLLHRWSGADDVLVGSPIANRNRVEIEGLVGFFVNTLVFRLRLREGDGFLDALRRVRAAALAGHDHQDLPFELLVEALFEHRAQPRPQPDLPGHAGGAERPDRGAASPRPDVSPVPWPTSTAKFDLTLTFAELDGASTARSNTAPTCSTARRSAVPRPLREPARGRRRGARSPPGRAASPLRAGDPPGDDRVAARAARAGGRRHARPPVRRAGGARPDAVAVSAPEGSLTYAALDELSNRLAERLAALGVGPEVPVASSCRARPLSWSSPSSAWSRPAAPTCRSIRPIRPSASRLIAGGLHGAGRRDGARAGRPPPAARGHGAPSRSGRSRPAPPGDAVRPAGAGNWRT